jgi:hypothetical protein
VTNWSTKDDKQGVTMDNIVFALNDTGKWMKGVLYKDLILGKLMIDYL